MNKILLRHKIQEELETRQCPKCSYRLSATSIRYDEEIDKLVILDRIRKIPFLRLEYSEEDEYLSPYLENLLEEGSALLVGVCYNCNHWDFVIDEGFSVPDSFNYNPFVINTKSCGKLLPNLFPSKLCLGTTKKKEKCKRGSIKGKNRCNTHIQSQEWLDLCIYLGIPVEKY